MYPDSSQQPPLTPQQSVDPLSYLDQIAPKTVNKFSFLQKKPMLIGLIAVVGLLAYIVISNLPKPVTLTETLAARLVATRTILTDATTKIKNSKLRSVNSNLNVFLTNTTRDISNYMTVTEVANLKNPLSSVFKAETSAPVLVVLEDARLNAVYDRTYSRELTYKLSTILTLMNQVMNNTNSAEFKVFLEKTRTNLEPIQVEFAQFYEKNS